MGGSSDLLYCSTRSLSELHPGKVKAVIQANFS